MKRLEQWGLVANATASLDNGFPRFPNTFRTLTPSSPGIGI